jgi:hypothetical protein
MGAAGLALLPRAARADALQARLVAAYPDRLLRADGNAILWRDGTAMPWSDGRLTKSFDEKLADPSLADQMSLPYRPGTPLMAPAVNDDPGRFRNIAFFKKMYGGSAAAVRDNLVAVPWRIGRYRDSLPFTRVNGVDRIAADIVAALAALPERFAAYLVPPAGTFNWRPIAGTTGLSAHAFGIAVDINTDHSDYWRWEHGGPWRNAIPFEIVDIFERRGFIWGGKWFHFDTMHFEYRPELLPPAG